MKQLSRIQTALMLAFLVTVWGINWPLTKAALAYSPPLLFAGIRTLIGGLLLLMVALPRFKKLRFKETWPIYLISAILNITLFYGLQTVGLNYLPAGLFSAIVFFQPVLMGVFSWLWLGESMYPLKIAGLILGFSGVAVISSAGFGGHISIAGILLALGSAVSWALGTVYVKRTGGRADSIWMVALQLLIGGVLLVSSGSFSESFSAIQWKAPFILSLLFISVFVIALGWLAFFTLVGSGEASKVASYTFLIPLISIVVSSIFLHEALTVSLLAGLLLIVTSICFVNITPKRLKTPALAAEKKAAH
ncbi:EamA family transporter [Bacillus siamensis]|uniref:DMT family transporter n=1 Tax=Bacillus siamensis TaxID=659243 RepID=UPI000BA7BF55|nr:DMT family transporter [Bacillus siamensis]MEC3655198.1 DMT family transporter [Bacillus siamensis]PAD64005.1 EamA family transporter [Bacillus siamensis]